MEGIQKSFRIGDVQFEYLICAVLDHIDVHGEKSSWALSEDSVCYFYEQKSGEALPVLGAIAFTPTDEGIVCDIVCGDVASAEFIYERFIRLEGMVHETEDLAVREVGSQAVNG